MNKKFIFIIILNLIILGCNNIKPEPSYDTNAGNFIALQLIDGYKNIISTIDGPRSGSYPTGTIFGIQAFNNYGFIKGSIITASRLLHEIEDNNIYFINKFGNIRKLDPLNFNVYWWDEAVIFNNNFHLIPSEPIASTGQQ